MNSSRRYKIIATALIPLVLLFILLALFFKFGPLGVFKTALPPIENVFIEKVALSPEHIKVDFINDGPDPVTIAQVYVNDAFWRFDISPDETFKPLHQGNIDIFYPWIEGEPLKISLYSSNGGLFEKDIEAAAITPELNGTYLRTFILLGVYVGVIPVLLGLLWLPFLRQLKGRWFNFLLAMTVGLLVFLGVDALSESIELIGDLPHAFNGVGILLIGFLLAILTLSTVSYKTQHLRFGRGGHSQALLFGYLIALGIGLHNLGEGLAIGSAYSLGEVALGSSLVVGFMLHNVTEGIAIVAPLTRTIRRIKDDILHLILMGVLAGAPTILGTLIGGFSYHAELAVFFLAIGSGAIFDVVFDIVGSMKETTWSSIFTTTNALGFLFGLFIIYATGFLVF